MNLISLCLPSPTYLPALPPTLSPLRACCLLMQCGMALCVAFPGLPTTPNFLPYLPLYTPFLPSHRLLLKPGTLSNILSRWVLLVWTDVTGRRRDHRHGRLFCASFLPCSASPCLLHAWGWLDSLGDRLVLPGGMVQAARRRRGGTVLATWQRAALPSVTHFGQTGGRTGLSFLTGFGGDRPYSQAYASMRRQAA